MRKFVLLSNSTKNSNQARYVHKCFVQFSQIWCTAFIFFLLSVEDMSAMTSWAWWGIQGSVVQNWISSPYLSLAKKKHSHCGEQESVRCGFNRIFRDSVRNCGQNITDATVCTGGKTTVVLHNRLLNLRNNEWGELIQTSPMSKIRIFGTCK